MTPPAGLQTALAAILGEARLSVQRPPGCSQRLWLLDPDNMARAFDAEETRRILEAPPYWCFGWASGLALARWLQEHPQQVRGKRVLDFGSGSGIVAIAAAQAGAAQVVACDIDPLALAAVRANAQLNQVGLDYASDLSAAPGAFDLITVADVLYDRANLPWLDALLTRGRQVLLADSRVRDLRHPGYRPLAHLQACTWPDLAEPDEFRRVTLYRGDAELR